MADRKSDTQIQAFLADLSDLLIKHDVVGGIKADDIVFESDSMLNDRRRNFRVNKNSGSVGLRNHVSWQRDS